MWAEEPMPGGQVGLLVCRDGTFGTPLYAPSPQTRHQWNMASREKERGQEMIASPVDARSVLLEQRKAAAFVPLFSKTTIIFTH